MSMNYENEIQNLSGTGGFGGGGFLTGLIFGALFDGGFGNKKSGDCAVENAILNQTIAENTQFANLNNVVTNATYTIENDISQLKDVTSAGFYVLGRASLDSITLSEQAPAGVEYHEAWHRVSNLLISENKRKKIFKRINKDGRMTEAEIDEMLAEQFRDFMNYA